MSVLTVAWDLLAVCLWYVAAVLLRIGGRLELTEIGGLLIVAPVAAMVQIVGNASLGVYRPDWPRRLGELPRLAGPAAAVGTLVGLFNVVSDTHPIPYAAIPTAALLSLFSEIAIHVGPRWGDLSDWSARPVRTFVSTAVPPEPHLERLFVAPDSDLRAAIRVIDSDVSRIALVAEPDRRLLGVVTDGDIRRAILGGADLSAPVTAAMTRDPISAPPTATDGELLELMQQRAVRQVPIVEDGRVVGIRLLDLLHTAPAALCTVMIMAGGLGTRLGAVTKGTPKPLVRIGGRPILEMLVRDLVAQGFRRIILAVNYGRDLIEGHFGDGTAFGAEITYVREHEPLGTAGAIRLARDVLDGDFIVTNADLLTRVNFRELLSFHRRHGHDLTVGIIESTLQLRYGLVETKGTRITAIREKPALKHFVNAGIYVLRPELIDLIPPAGRFDMDALIARSLDMGSAVGGFPIHEYWTDIGEPDDLRRAASEFASRASEPSR